MPNLENREDKIRKVAEVKVSKTIFCCFFKHESFISTFFWSIGLNGESQIFGDVLKWKRSADNK
jgi:hypothetical protein